MFSMKAHMQKEVEKPPAVPCGFSSRFFSRDLPSEHGLQEDAPEVRTVHNRDQSDTATLIATQSPPRPAPISQRRDLVHLTHPYENSSCMRGLITKSYYDGGQKLWLYLFFHESRHKVGWVEEGWLRDREKEPALQMLGAVMMVEFM